MDFLNAQGTFFPKVQCFLYIGVCSVFPYNGFCALIKKFVNIFVHYVSKVYVLHFQAY